MEKAIKTLILTTVTAWSLQAQNYINLFDGSGVLPTPNEIGELELAAQNVIDALPDRFQSQFKVYDYGFYTLNENMVEGFDSVWDRVIADVEDRPESDYYVIFGRESESKGINSRIRVELKLPDSHEFDCFDDVKRINVEKYIQAQANEKIDVFNAYLSEKDALGLLQLYINKIILCECSGVRSQCDLSGDFRIINPELLGLGFRRKEITIGRDCNWTNGNQGITDYFGKQVEIDGIVYCLTEEIAEGKAIFDSNVQNLPDTTINTSITGEVYILNGESFINGEWEDAKLRSTLVDYVEYWAIIYDPIGDKHYLYSMFTIGDIEETPVALRGKNRSQNRSGVTLSPMGAALKLLGNAAVDACMQAVIIRLVDDKVKSKPSEGERWTAAFGEVSYLGAAWEGVSSLLPWKKDLVSTIVKTAAGALAVVVDKARQPDYTVRQGFVDFGIGFGASGLTQLITPKLGQFGGRIISNGLDNWYEKTTSTVLRRIIFYCSKNFDDYVSRVVKSQKYIAQNDVIAGVKKIDLMGGNKSQLGDGFINVDLRETIEKGIKGDATKLGQYIPHNSIDEIVTNNPYLIGATTAEDYIKEVAKVLKSGKRIYINGQVSNKYFNNVNHQLADQYGFVIEKLKVDLLDQFKSIKFYKSDGVTPIQGTMLSTVLRKL